MKTLINKITMNFKKYYKALHEQYPIELMSEARVKLSEYEKGWIDCVNFIAKDYDEKLNKLQPMSDHEIENIAIVAHEANRAWCKLHHDDSQVSWNLAEDWQKQSSIKDVLFVSNNLNVKSSAIHDNWMKDKISDGWAYGAVKSSINKTHPCIIPFEKLSKFNQQKDALFISIVKSFIND